MEAAIKINEIIIQSSKETKYLGVIFDQKLKFHSHIDHVIAKGIKYALAIAEIVKS